MSAGAIIAPFAFLGPAHDRQLAEIWTEYGTSELLTAQILPGLLGGPSLADTSKLAELVARYVDRKFLRAIAVEYRRGRILLIGTTNLDMQRPIIWNMGEIAASNHPQALELFRKVILASASIPGVFPPVPIKVEAEGVLFDELHIDGGPTRQVFLAPAQISLRDFDVFYDKPPVRHIYIIRNSKLAPTYQAATSNVLAISVQTISTLIMNQSQGDILRIYTTATRDGAHFNLAAIPDDFPAQPKEAFDRAYMQELFKTGEALARSGYRWIKAPPELGRSNALR